MAYVYCIYIYVLCIYIYILSLYVYIYMYTCDIYNIYVYIYMYHITHTYIYIYVHRGIHMCIYTLYKHIVYLVVSEIFMFGSSSFPTAVRSTSRSLTLRAAFGPLTPDWECTCYQGIERVGYFSFTMVVNHWKVA